MQIRDSGTKIELMGYPLERLRLMLTLTMVSTLFVLIGYFFVGRGKDPSIWLLSLLVIGALLFKEVVGGRVFRILVEPGQFTVKSLWGARVSKGEKVKAVFFLARRRQNEGSVPTVLVQQKGKGVRVEFTSLEMAEGFLKRCQEIYPALEIEDLRNS